MFAKLGALWALFRKGEEVSDPEKWKSRQITGTMLAGLLLAIIHLAKTFGYDIPMDEDTASTIGVGVIAAANVVLTMVTSKKAGLQALDKAIDYSDPETPRNDR